MRKYFNFIVTALMLISFIFILSKTTLINGDAVFLTSYKFVLYIIFGLILLFSIIDQILDKEYKITSNIFSSIFLSVIIVRNNDTSLIVLATLILTFIYTILFFKKTFKPKEPVKLILPPGTYRKSQYYGLLVAVTLLCFIESSLFFLFEKWYFKLLVFGLFFIAIFICIIMYQFITQLTTLRIHKRFIISGDYNKFKEELNALKKDYLHKETINQINLILINYGVERDKEYIERLIHDVFKPSLEQYIGLYNQTMATYYLNKKDYDNARLLVNDLKASTNKALVFIGKRFDVAIRLDLNEKIDLSEIDEIADYSNSINTLATYQMYARFYEKRDYNKYVEYVNKINQVKNYVK